MFTWRSKLFAAADKGEVAKIAVLLASGRNPNVQGERRYVRGTPLHVAANAGHSEIVRMLVEAGADMEQPSGGLIGSGYTALHWAVEAAHSGVVKVLLGLGANFTARDQRHGYTPLHLACLKTCQCLYTGTYPVSVDIVRLLLKSGANPNDRDSKGQTALFHATFSSGSLEATEALLDAGADVNALNRSGQTPLFWADGIGIVELLISRGAAINIQDHKGWTPRRVAAFNGLHDSKVSLLDSLGPNAGRYSL